MSATAGILAGFAGGIARSLSAGIIKHQTKHLKDTVAGPSLMKLGLVKPSFEVNLKTAIEKAAIKYFTKNTQQMLGGVERFLSSEPVSAAI